MTATASARGPRTIITIEGDVQVITPNAETVPTSQPQAKQLGYSIEQVTELTGISRSKLEEYMRDGSLISRKNGRHYLILPDELDAFLHALPIYRSEDQG